MGRECIRNVLPIFVHVTQTASTDTNSFGTLSTKLPANGSGIPWRDFCAVGLGICSLLVPDGHNAAKFINSSITSEVSVQQVGKVHADFLFSFLCFHRIESHHQMQPGVSFQTPS